MSKKHKHAELIKAWANGATIQVLSICGNRWNDMDNLGYWNEHRQYRIKPEPKPDLTFYGIALHYTKFKAEIKLLGPYNRNELNNIKLIFDGETGKLKSVEIIK